MSAFRDVETTVLIDMLARNTLQLTELFIRKDLGKEYEYYKNVIQDLQSEIERRRSAGGGEQGNAAPISLPHQRSD